MSEFIILGSESIERQHLVARASEGVEKAMNELLTQFIVENRDEVNARLAPFGITIDRIMQPEWLVQDLYTYRCPECGFFHLTREKSFAGQKNLLVHVAAPEELQRWAMGGMAL